MQLFIFVFLLLKQGSKELSYVLAAAGIVRYLRFIGVLVRDPLID